jgi:hypothetical protein
LPRARQAPVFVEQARLARHADQRSRRVEDGHQKEREHDGDEPELQGIGEIHLEEGGCERGRLSEDSLPGLEPERDCRNRDRKDAENDRARYFPHCKRRDEQEASGRKPGLRLRQIAKGDERGGIVGDDARVLKRDQREEKSDAGGDAELQAHREGIDQPGAQRRERKREEEDPRDEHESERKLPIALKLGNDGEGKIGVEPHTGGERDGVVRVKPHDDGARRRGEAGGDEDRAMIHPRLLEDRGVDEHDVGHGEEGGEPGAKLGSDARA